MILRNKRTGNACVFPDSIGHRMIAEFPDKYEEQQ